MDRKEMQFEYEILKEEFMNSWQEMSTSRFNYSLGQLNTLAGWTGNLQDYADNILRPIDFTLGAIELLH